MHTPRNAIHNCRSCVAVGRSPENLSASEKRKKRTTAWSYAKRRPRPALVRTSGGPGPTPVPAAEAKRWEARHENDHQPRARRPVQKNAKIKTSYRLLQSHAHKEPVRRLLSIWAGPRSVSRCIFDQIHRSMHIRAFISPLPLGYGARRVPRLAPSTLSLATVQLSTRRHGKSRDESRVGLRTTSCAAASVKRALAQGKQK